MLQLASVSYEDIVVLKETIEFRVPNVVGLDTVTVKLSDPVGLIGNIVENILEEMSGKRPAVIVFELPDLDTTLDRKSTRLNSSHIPLSRMPSSA